MEAENGSIQGLVGTRHNVKDPKSDRVKMRNGGGGGGSSGGTRGGGSSSSGGTGGGVGGEETATPDNWDQMTPRQQHKWKAHQRKRRSKA